MAEHQHTKERWLPVPGYEGCYEVSDQGRVRSLDRVVRYKDGRQTRTKGQELKPYRLKSGHHTVMLQTTGRIERYLVHRLVLITFVGPCPVGMEACHWNDNPADNRIENLRWASRRENNLDRVRNGIHPMANKTHCKRGHEFTPENTRIERRGTRNSRRCLACEKERARRRTQAEREARAKLPKHKPVKATHCKRGHEFTEENTYHYKNKSGRECKTCRDQRMKRWSEKQHSTR